MDSSIRMIDSVCGIGWNCYIVLFRQMDFGHQEDLYLLGVEKYSDLIYASSQTVCIPSS
jgi:hypothetical protein